MTDRFPENRKPAAALSRRNMVSGSAAALGFAVACHPVASTAQRTGGEGLHEADVVIPASDFSMPGFCARPADGDRPPVLIVIHEIFGIHEWIRDMCRRFAKAGYYAIAPDLFARLGDASKEPDIQKLLANIVSRTPDDQVMADLDATATFAGRNGSDPGRLGVTGFCWGGRMVWLYAAHNPALDAGVAFYGRLRGEPDAMHPKSPMDLAAWMKAPVLGQYGGMDHGIPASDADAMRAALRAAGKPGDLIVYPDADHGFMADYRPNYNEKAAKEAYARTLAWFKTYLE